MMGSSNMAPGSENDHRSGCHDDAIFCPGCPDDGIDDDCIYCHGEGIVSERKYDDMKELEREEDQANE